MSAEITIKKMTFTDIFLVPQCQKKLKKIAKL